MYHASNMNFIGYRFIGAVLPKNWAHLVNLAQDLFTHENAKLAPIIIY